MAAQFILTPKGDADFAQNVSAARALVGQKLELEMVDGSAAEYRALSQADQIRVADELAAFIVSQPQFFSPVAVQLSQKRVNSPGFRAPLADTSFATAAGQFVDELAGRVESKFTALAVVAIVAALAFAILPGAIARAKLAK